MRNRLDLGRHNGLGFEPRRRGGRAMAAAGVALGLVLAGPALPTSAATPDSWAATYGDAGNSANNPGETVIRAADAASLATSWIAKSQGTQIWAPPVSGGIAYRVLQATYGPKSLGALSARTGATLWSVPLPLQESYQQALVLAGNTVVIPFWGMGQEPGGLIAVDGTTHRIRWTRYLPPSSEDTAISNATTDGTRIFVSGSSNQINTYRVTDGALLWTLPITPGTVGNNSVDAMAVSGGVLYTTGTEGLVARSAATGQRLWSGAAGDRPVVAGGRVFAFYGSDLVAFSAGGCGHPTCTPLWRTALPNAPEHTIGGADGKVLFVNVHPLKTGYLARLSAVTGKIQWTVRIGSYLTGLVRGGNTIWLYAEYREGGADHNHILGFSTTATTATPLRTISLAGTAYEWFSQQLAIADGTLFEQPNGTELVGYRIPGT